MIYRVSLHRHGQVGKIALVYSLEQAARAVLDFQAAHNMGASDMGSNHGKVYTGDNVTNLTHVVSYNGRVWTKDGVEVTL